MKNILNYRIKLLIAFFGSVVLLSSCEYQKIADATYPDPVIYMPAATNGIFTIDNVPQRAEFLPTPIRSPTFLPYLSYQLKLAFCPLPSFQFRLLLIFSAGQFLEISIFRSMLTILKALLIQYLPWVSV